MAVTFRISELAADLAVTTRTIRFYEEQGLISPSRRGHERIYTPQERHLLRIALTGKQLGLTLADCRELLALFQADDPATPDAELNEQLERVAHYQQFLSEQKRAISTLTSTLNDIKARCQQQMTGASPSFAGHSDDAELVSVTTEVDSEEASQAPEVVALSTARVASSSEPSVRRTVSTAHVVTEPSPARSDVSATRVNAVSESSADRKLVSAASVSPAPDTSVDRREASAAGSAHDLPASTSEVHPEQRPIEPHSRKVAVSSPLKVADKPAKAAPLSTTESGDFDLFSSLDEKQGDVQSSAESHSIDNNEDDASRIHVEDDGQMSFLL
ncbi:MerR family transcriptional regulator [Zymobacter palmae]|uniref:Predicted transcriptional regulators n=1 Tax=Zymobacter palmae TaxID=33074 RepID=A0A348HBA9_9GAMM|nr:MerR family DNA-binding transcriptional regulator [Zymobacter palmae]BBG28911.1 predicted transcriptional regulators [Zymobacter palmae]